MITIGKNEKYNAAALAEHKRDHALFTAFAPVDNPKIVIALIVENGGFGASAAAPIARKAMDYFFYGKKSAPEAVQSVTMTRILKIRMIHNRYCCHLTPMKTVTTRAEVKHGYP